MPEYFQQWTCCSNARRGGNTYVHACTCAEKSFRLDVLWVKTSSRCSNVVQSSNHAMLVALPCSAWQCEALKYAYLSSRQPQGNPPRSVLVAFSSHAKIFGECYARIYTIYTPRLRFNFFFFFNFRESAVSLSCKKALLTAAQRRAS